MRLALRTWNLYFDNFILEPGICVLAFLFWILVFVFWRFYFWILVFVFWSFYKYRKLFKKSSL